MKFAPGPPVPVDEEIERVVPVVRELAPNAEIDMGFNELDGD